MAAAPTGPNSTDREPWERLPGESVQAYNAWQSYMLMPAPRSLRRVGQELDKSFALLSRWSSKWQWQRRLEAFLKDQQARLLRDAEQEIKDAKARHVSISKVLQNKALQRLQNMDTSRLSPNALVKFLALAVEMERKALGMDKPAGKTTITQTSIPDFSVSETHEPQSELHQAFQQLSSIPRDIMRQRTVKLLKFLKSKSEPFDWSTTALSDATDAQPRGSDEAKPAGDGGSEPPAAQHTSIR